MQIGRDDELLLGQPANDSLGLGLDWVFLRLKIVREVAIQIVIVPIIPRNENMIEESTHARRGSKMSQLFEFLPNSSII